MNQVLDIFLEAVKVLLAGLVGGLVGARANDKFTRAREREASVVSRRREFLLFLETWRGEIAHAPAVAQPVVAEIFMGNVAKFVGMAATVRDCFGDKAEFERLVEGFSRIDTSCLGPQPDRGKNSLLQVMQPLLNFVRAEAGASPPRQPTANELLDLVTPDDE